MFSVEDYRWLDSMEGQFHWSAITSEIHSSNTSALLKKLRTQLPANHASLLMEQLELMSIASRKIHEPRDWFWTKQLLEQSSDEETAAESALDFPLDACVNDLCCGAGADAIAIAKRGLRVRALDRCPIACQLTRRNAAKLGLSVEVEQGNAEQTVLESDGFIHLDPDRRADGGRTTHLERLSPSWQAISKLIEGCKGMSLKMAPGLRMDWRNPILKLDQPPESVRFLSKDGSVRQQRWYWGIERWPTGATVLSMFLNTPSERRAQEFCKENSHDSAASMSPNQRWFHEIFFKQQIESESSDRAGTDTLSRFIGDYDPSIRAAELTISFASRYGWNLLDSNSGYLTAKSVQVHPMVRWFEVVENLPVDTKHLKAFARSANVRSWELKSRGIEIDLISMRRILTASGANAKGRDSRTVLFTKLNGRHRAIVCREV